MTIEKEIGKKVREIRLSKRITLEELANRTNFTKGYLSKVEHSEKGPPVSTLIRIAEALGVKISKIFGEEEKHESVTLVKKSDRKKIVKSGTQFGYSYESLAHKFPNRVMDPYVLTHPPHKEKDRYNFKHPGQEMIYVLQGKMEFCHGDKRYILEEGDCTYFDSNIEHHTNSIGDTDIKMLMVIYTPESEK